MGSLIDKGKVVDKIQDLFLDKYEEKANSDLTGFFKEVLKILVNEKSQSGWINVKDRLPDNDEPVLVCTENKAMFVYSLVAVNAFENPKNSKMWEDDYGYYVTDVTHWMPLPQRPESEDAE